MPSPTSPSLPPIFPLRGDYCAPTILPVVYFILQCARIPKGFICFYLYFVLSRTYTHPFFHPPARLALNSRRRRSTKTFPTLRPAADAPQRIYTVTILYTMNISKTSRLARVLTTYRERILYENGRMICDMHSRCWSDYYISFFGFFFPKTFLPRTIRIINTYCAVLDNIVNYAQGSDVNTKSYVM